MVAILGFSREKVMAAVRTMYTEVAARPGGHFHFPVGRQAAASLGYPPEWLDAIPPGAVESFAGVGYPFRAGVIREGDRVLDVGSGSGTDALTAARLVGPGGKVYALDTTPAMAEKLSRLAAGAGFANVEVVRGDAESIPLPEASVDVVTSNGVINLVPDKRKAVREIFRVLKPGGRVQLADIVIRRPVTPDCKADPALWAECVVGATVDDDYLDLFRDAGFEEVAVLRDYDYFRWSPSSETREVAGRFGARAMELSMRRAAAAPSPWAQAARRLSPGRALRSIMRRGWAGVLALGLAVITCYGSLAAGLLLSVAGVGLAVNEAAVGAMVVAFAVLAAAAIVPGVRKHGAALPAVFAVAGAGIVAWTHLVAFRLDVEFAGFALIAAALWLDHRARTRAESTDPAPDGGPRS